MATKTKVLIASGAGITAIVIVLFIVSSGESQGHADSRGASPKGVAEQQSAHSAERVPKTAAPRRASSSSSRRGESLVSGSEGQKVEKSASNVRDDKQKKRRPKRKRRGESGEVDQEQQDGKKKKGRRGFSRAISIEG